MSDAICPTYSAGTTSTWSMSFLNDAVVKGQPNGYVNETASMTVGSFNNGWGNGCLSQNVAPTYTTSLLDFGRTGRQS